MLWWYVLAITCTAVSASQPHLTAKQNEARVQYEDSMFKLALKASYYDFINSRDTYRFVMVSARP